MHNSKLIKMLKMLKTDEFKQLDRFLKSPYFNSNKRIVALYQYLKKYYPDFNSPKLDREVVYKHLFPKKAFNYTAMSNFTAAFNRLLERFFAELEFEAAPYAERKMLIVAYEKRGASEWFDKHTDALVAKLKSLPVQDAEVYREIYLLLHNKINQPHVNRYTLMTKDFATIDRHLNTFFMVEKLRLGAEIQARSNILAEKQEVWLLEEVTAEAEQDKWDVFIRIYAAVIRLQQTGNEANFYHLKNLFEEHRASLEIKEQGAILLHLINYAIKAGNSGQKKFKIACLELYKIGLEHSLLLVNHQLADSNYTNIAYLAVSVTDYEWCEQFIFQYAFLLEDTIRSDAKHLCLGYLYYHQEKYDAATKLLFDLEFKDVFYQLRAKHILLKIYFEEFLKDNSYFDMLILQLNAFEKMIKRNKTIYAHTSQIYLAFIKQLRQLATYKMDIKYTDSWKLKTQKEIAQNANILSKQWLLQQVQNL